MTHNDNQFSRRTALQTVAGLGFVSATGCLGAAQDDDTTVSADQDIIKNVGVDETTLHVELISETPVDQLNLIQPNGELFGRREVNSGSQQVSFEIGTSYIPGEYNILALNDGQKIVEMSFPINPDIRIIEMGIGRNHPEKMWNESIDKIGDEVFVTVENQGNGPEIITKLLVVGDVPYPSDEDGTNYANHEDVSGIYDPQVDEEISETNINPGNQITIYSYRSPFAFVPGGKISCKGERQKSEFKLILETQIETDRVAKRYDVQYLALDEAEDCSIIIGGPSNG